MKKLIRYNSTFLFWAIIILINSMPWSINYFVLTARCEQLNKGEEETEVFVYTRDERRDPFVSLIDKSGDYRDNVPSTKEEMMDLIKLIKIGGILWDEEMPLAMINNEIHKIGDIINNLTIKQITPESVTFSYSDLTHTITIIEKKNF
ncbi:MAG: hypothetical protein V1747_02815 [Candidatus Omnitrophota bacterium]